MNVKLFATLGLLLSLWLPAGAALARIDDAAGALDADAEAVLDRDLGQLGTHQFDVVLVQHVDGAIERYAQMQFRDHRLDADDGLIVIAVGDRKVGVHLGQTLKDQGVGSQQIKSHLRSDFFPQAKAGHFDTATVQLAKGLIQEAQVAAPPVHVRHHQPGHGSHGGFPWLLFFFLMAVVGGGWWWFSRYQIRERLAPRIKALKAQHANLVAQALRLDDVDTLGRFREGDVVRQYQTLARRSADLMTESLAFGEQLVSVEKEAQKGTSDAEARVRGLEGRITGLQADVAAALTTLDRLEGTSGLSGGDEDLPKLVSRLTRRYEELRDAYAQIARRAPQGYDTDTTVERRLREANQLLITPPVDVQSAEEVILEAADALEDYRCTVDGEQDREAIRQGNSGSVWADTASVLPYLMLQSSYHRPYFASSFTDSPVVVVNEHGYGGGSASDTASGWGADASGSWGESGADSDSGSGGGGFWGGFGGDSDSGADGGGSWDDSGGGDSGGGDW